MSHCFQEWHLLSMFLPKLNSIDRSVLPAKWCIERDLLWDCLSLLFSGRNVLVDGLQEFVQSTNFRIRSSFFNRGSRFIRDWGGWRRWGCCCGGWLRFTLFFEFLLDVPFHFRLLTSRQDRITNRIEIPIELKEAGVWLYHRHRTICFVNSPQTLPRKRWSQSLMFESIQERRDLRISKTSEIYSKNQKSSAIEWELSLTKRKDWICSSSMRGRVIEMSGDERSRDPASSLWRPIIQWSQYPFDS